MHATLEFREEASLRGAGASDVLVLAVPIAHSTYGQPRHEGFANSENRIIGSGRSDWRPTGKLAQAGSCVFSNSRTNAVCESQP